MIERKSSTGSTARVARPRSLLTRTQEKKLRRLLERIERAELGLDEAKMAWVEFVREHGTTAVGRALGEDKRRVHERAKYWAAHR